MDGTMKNQSSTRMMFYVELSLDQAVGRVWAHPVLYSVVVVVVVF